MNKIWKHFKKRVLLVGTLVFATGLSVTLLFASWWLNQPALNYLVGWVMIHLPFVAGGLLLLIAALAIPANGPDRRSSESLDLFADDSSRNEALDNIAVYGNIQGVYSGVGHESSGIIE